ncbi:phosphatidylinositol glycan anchor biosynthesis class O [Arctopsyche grandis]|uniref:phosphatidylinositol glycan anchor biosynthesis class O n=1 Tax=Arctopsyche grandis TaxID=121162 RepID=UPI00406D6977
MGVRYGLFMLWISYLVCGGALLFGRGFLLSREARVERTKCQPYQHIPCGPLESGHSGSEHGCTPRQRLASLALDLNSSNRACPPARAKVVVLLIDALRFDFAWTNLDSEPEPDAPSYTNRLPAITRMLRQQPKRSRLYQFIADPPTTTLQRLKGLTTGSLPTFIDVGSNFATPEINEDNLIDQLVSHGGKAVLLGDDTWAQLYPKRWLRSLALPSFNTWDLDTVDNAVKARLPEELEKKDWQLLVAHFLGVDHCGHRYGPLHSEMVRKLTEMNQVIEDTLQTLDNDTVLFVIGDHGMTITGDHGGETDAEVTAAMFMYSPYDLMSPPELLSPRTVRQVDFVPTVSSILGLPPPYSNLGAIILNSLPFSGDSNIPFNDWQFALINLWANVKQVTKYIQHYSLISDQFPIEKIDSIEKKFIILSHRVQSIYNERAFYSFATDAREFLIDVRSMCQEVWIQFDSFSMSRGLLMIFLTIFFCYMIVDGIPPERFPEIFQSSYLLYSYGAMFFAVLFSVGCYYFSLIERLGLTILFSTGVVSVFMLSMLVIQNWEVISQNWYETTRRKDWVDLSARASLAFSTCALFSNSYIVEEGAVLSYLLLSLLVVLSYSSGIPKILYPLLICTATPLAASRFYKVCREEQGECYYKNEDTGQTSPMHLVTGLASLALLVILTRLWLRSCGNLVSHDAILWRYAPTVAAVCTGGYWVASWSPHKVSWRADSIARLVFGILAVSIIVLIIKPLSIFVLPKQNDSVSVYGQDNIVPQLFNQMKGLFNKHSLNNKRQANTPVVYGLATVYSAAFVMLTVCVTLLISLVLGARSAPSIILLFATGASMLAMLAVNRYHTSTSLAQLLTVDNCSIQCWVLLSVYYFYGTGHQAALSSIQWGAAFVGTGGHFTFNAVPAILVIANTFGAQFLAGLCIPLLVLAPFPMFVMWGHPSRHSSKVDIQRGELMLYERETMLMAAMFSTSTKYILFHSVRMFVCMLAATVHCRHLMVWKIFAPKMIFEGISLMITLIAVLISYFILLRIHSRLSVFIAKLNRES